MTSLPIPVNFATAANSTWTQTFTLPSVDITGLTWEFVIRSSVTDATVPALVSVTTTVSSQGQITVDTTARTVQVTLKPAATTLLGRGARPYTLWSNPGPSQIAWAEGVFNTSLVAAP